MHGTKRTKKDLSEEKKRRDSVKIKQYQALVRRAYELRKASCSDTAALNVTTQVLEWNPEFYTIWNYRREIMLAMIQRGCKDVTTNSNDATNIGATNVGATASLLDSDLRFLETILQKSPKIYWIWNHRQWCLENNPKPDWPRELKLVSKMLELDARNFHGWHYRRYVITNMEKHLIIPPQQLLDQEFDYTTKKINANFSNFSAWHNRTKLMPRYLDVHYDQDTSKRLDFYHKEMQYLLNALYTDPDDQSAWLYHRWLLTNIDELVPGVGKADKLAVYCQQQTSIHDLYALEPDSKWCSLSLLHVKQLLSSLDPEEFPLEVHKLTQELVKLQQMDPLRVNRYKHLIREIQSRNEAVMGVI